MATDPRCPMFCADTDCIDACQYDHDTARFERRGVYVLPPIKIDHDEALALAAYVSTRDAIGRKEDHGETIERTEHEHLDDTARELLDLLLDRYNLDGEA